MTANAFLGEFEQLVMLTLLQLEDRAHAITIRHHLAVQANRQVTRGALYRTLDRLEEKGYLSWVTDEPTPDRGGHPKRRFFVTQAGIAALRVSQHALHNLTNGLDAILGQP